MTVLFFLHVLAVHKCTYTLCVRAQKELPIGSSSKQRGSWSPTGRRRGRGRPAWPPTGRVVFLFCVRYGGGSGGGFLSGLGGGWGMFYYVLLCSFMLMFFIK